MDRAHRACGGVAPLRVAALAKPGALLLLGLPKGAQMRPHRWLELRRARRERAEKIATLRRQQARIVARADIIRLGGLTTLRRFWVWVTR